MLVGLGLLSLVAALPGLSSRLQISLGSWQTLGQLSSLELARAIDSAAFPLAEEIAAHVPEDGCVSVLAYAGADAVEYYRSRLAYLLYPRRSLVVPRTGGGLNDCGYVAVYRDTPENLAGSPFAGRWDQQRLDERTAELELVSSSRRVLIYRRR